MDLKSLLKKHKPQTVIEDIFQDNKLHIFIEQKREL